MNEALFSVGHSTHKQEHFINLLLQHRITVVCDVRSKPYSRMNPQFNREELERALFQHGITYRFFGKELGARSDDRTCYREGRVQYELLAATAVFRSGIERILSELQSSRIALMCAEKEPLECHRTILVARQLARRGVDIQHIHADGHLESHAAAVRRLEHMHGLAEDNLFLSREELLEDAYRRQEERIAYEAEDEDIHDRVY